ncbi:TIGR04282 family arsenosugar biosynthesis glycosyltransferase [Robertkochia flava]|uniref:TIGR04282 family arsenosugar biosynthesis glycosyltransferase n=1 Tax=Robertkochia flava TaxID=3447986 RepID=UPI001CCED66D|nr:TIGR04282 family arsenosugar biosynthesis glycosyltransferase [Robertkochia marina]
MSKELLVFVKNPVAGKVKTRLGRDIGEEAALKIYLYLLHHTLKVCSRVKVKTTIYFSEHLSQEITSLYPGFSYCLQEGNDLGERMENAFRDAFSRGTKEAIIIGSDLYTLNENVLTEGFETLTQKDMVLGPAKDGGYYLLGLKHIPRGIFEEKAWGTDTILKSTLNNLKGYDVALLGELNDIDVLEDLMEYPELLKLAKSEQYGKTT